MRIFPHGSFAHHLALVKLLAAVPLALCALAAGPSPGLVLLATALSLAAAHAYGRRMTNDMTALMAIAGRLGDEAMLPAPPRSDVTEMTLLGRALVDAHREFRERRHEQELRVKAQAERAAAEAANQSKDLFIATLSHELRGTLTAMMGWLEVGRARPDDRETVQKALDIALRNGRQQARIMDDLLDVARIVSGKFDLAPAPLDVARLARDALEAARPAADEKAIELRLTSHAPVFIEGDRARMQQVLANLLGNAIKFGNQNGWVELTVERAERHVRITVADNGMGIHADALPHVFERFWQARAVAPRRRRGLGLGLALVRHVVELHGGHCRAESAGPGLGARFTVELPLLVNAPEALYPPQSNGAEDIDPHLNGLGIVALDENDDTLCWLQHLLAAHGAMTWKARSLDEAVGLVEREQADVLICDSTLVEDNAQLIRALHPPLRRRVAAVVFSSQPTAEECERSLAAGYDAFVAKPCDPGALLRAVKAAVERHAA